MEDQNNFMKKIPFSELSQLFDRIRGCKTNPKKLEKLKQYMKKYQDIMEKEVRLNQIY